MIIPVIFPSAAAFWLNYSTETDNDIFSFSERERVSLPDSFELSVNKQQALFISGLTGSFLPVYVMSPKGKRKYYDSKTVKSLQYPSHFPSESFIEVTDGIHIASPELCFLQAAAVLTEEELLILGTELCGKYVYDESSEFHQRSRKPITSVEKILKFLQHAELCYGRQKAIQISRYLTDNSNSRMESMLAVMSRLPASAGGYAVPAPGMNKIIIFSEEGEKIMKGKSCFGDMVWESEKVVVEYDSDLTHLSSEQHYKDKQRASAISISGYTLFTITKRNVCSITELDKTFKTLRHILGMRSIDPKLEKYKSKREKVIETFRRFKSNDPRTYSPFLL